MKDKQLYTQFKGTKNSSDILFRLSVITYIPLFGEAHYVMEAAINKTYRPIETLNRHFLAYMEKTAYICNRKNNQ